MEAKQMQSGRSVQGLRLVPRSSYVRARNPDLWRRSHLRHGRPIHAARTAVHAQFRE